VTDKKLIWDIPVRIFHWLLVILVGWSWYAVEINDDLETHMLLGYCILTLLIFRISWGFIGTRYARFGSFIYSAGEILTCIRKLFSRQYGNYPGHNPLGGLSVTALLLLLVLQAGTGLFANDEEYYFGPLSDNVSSHTATVLTEIHHLNFNILFGLIILHVVSVLFYLFYKKENLLLPMFTGKKTDPLNKFESISGSRLLIAVILLLICSSLIYCLVTFA